MSFACPLADGRWEARYTIGRDPGTGKQAQRSVYADTQKEARQRLQQITASVNDGTYSEPSRMTVGQWLDLWSEEYLNAVKPATIDKYKRHIRIHLKPAIGSVKLTALNPTEIQQLYNSELKNGLSPKSIKDMHGVLHKALSQAVKLCYIRSNPSDACDLPRVEKAHIKPLQGESVSKFLHAIKGTRFEYLYYTALFTGMREGEILGLTWPCIDFEKGTVKVENRCSGKEKRAGNTVLYRLKTIRRALLPLRRLCWRR